MARVRSSNTKPELQVRRLLTERGVRYRLHRKDLPGKPDLYVPRLRLALFINGCFWHGHSCPRGRRPSTNVAFWDTKISKNIERDKAARQALSERGIEACILWTCAMRDFEVVIDVIASKYGKPN